MPRANRNYMPGYVWHLTHRCHRRQFLLRFARDRQVGDQRPVALAAEAEEIREGL